MLTTINLHQWIADHRHLLRPPVGNAQIWKDREFMVTVVGGPNQRKDYHIDPGEEFFYQLEGDMTLRLIENGEFRDLPIREGEIFLLPPLVPHSPSAARTPWGWSSSESGDPTNRTVLNGTAIAVGSGCTKSPSTSPTSQPNSSRCSMRSGLMSAPAPVRPAATCSSHDQR